MRDETPLDSILLVQQRCRSSFSNIFSSVDIESGKHFDINCGSWRCPKHRKKWGNKWAQTISDQIARTPVTILVNLTTAQRTSNVEVFVAMQRFIRQFRAKYGPTEYVKVVEENKKHTQPHFHCLFCCRDLVIPPRPPYDCTCTEKQKCKECSRSYPDYLFEDIKEMWGEALHYANPRKKRTIIVWCQPPIDDQGGASAGHAVSYITGEGKSKNEEPGKFWKGRKLTYSKGFFNDKPAEIWKRLLLKWYGPKEDMYFAWLPKANLETDTPRADKYGQIKHYNGDLPDLAMFAAMPIVQTRYAQYKYFQEHGELPTEALVELEITVIFEVDQGGQEYFSTS